MGSGGILDESPRPEPDRVKCQFCGEEYTERGITRHENACDHNPANQVKKVAPDNGEVLKIVKGLMTEIRDLKDQVEDANNLVIMGKKRVLNAHNLLQYFKKVDKTKLYELKRYFHEYTTSEINDLLKEFYRHKIVFRNRDGWYYLNPRR